MKIKKENYTSNEYYHEFYPTISLKQSSMWMANYFTVIKQIFPQIFDYQKKKVLEIGSSHGGFIHLLNQAGFTDVTASDMNKSVLAKEIKNKYVSLDIMNPPFTKTYDVLISFEVMEHIFDSEKVVKNIYKLLNMNGIYIFTTPYPKVENLYHKYHINVQYPNYWTNLFHRHGFRLLKVQHASFVPMLWRYIQFPFFFKRAILHKAFTAEEFFIFEKYR